MQLCIDCPGYVSDLSTATTVYTPTQETGTPGMTLLFQAIGIESPIVARDIFLFNFVAKAMPSSVMWKVLALTIRSLVTKKLQIGLFYVPATFDL